MFIDLLQKRRSIRKFEDKPVSLEHRDFLIEAALRSPSGRGINPWHFVVVEDKEHIEKLSRSKPHGAGFLKNAPLVIAVCADTTKTDIWVEDSAIAATIIHLAAQDLGLGSCWVQMRLRSHEDGCSCSDYISNVLNLPKHFEVEAVIGIGYPAEQKKGHAAETLLYNKVSYEQFGRTA